jgi:hypothetical protein
MADVEIGEINTRVEVTAPTGASNADLRTLVERVLQRIQHEQAHEDMRDEDGRIRDRSWKSDVKPD